MNARILSLAAAAAIAITSLGSLAPANAAPLGATAQALSGQAGNLVIEAKGHGKGHKGKNWTFGKGKHFKFHFGKGYYPATYYPSWCWETRLMPTKYGYVEKRVFICY